MSERPRLPFIELFNWLGLYTKGSNEVVNDAQLRVAENTDFFSSYGAISKPPGMSRVLASESGNGNISWVGFYKAADLNGAVLRHALVANGTKLSRVTGTAGSATLTALTGTGKNVTEARTAGLFHDSAMFGDFLLISNQDPDLVGNGNTLVKYDGDAITQWGVKAPGSQDTVQEGFGTASSFSVSNCTASDNAVTTKDGASVEITPTSNGTVVYIQKTLTSTFSVSIAVANRGLVYAYIPRGEITNLAVENALQVYVGSDANLSSNYYRFDFDIGELVEGWNALQLDFSSPSEEVGSATNTALRTIRFSATQYTGREIDGLVWDKFLSYDTGVLTSAEGAADSTFADASVYIYRVSFNSKYGQGSNGGPASAALTMTAGRSAITITNIPVSEDPQVVSRTLWRTVNGGSVYLNLATIYDNTTTTYSDTTADASLGSTQPPLAADTSDDNSLPPAGGIVKVWKRTVFIAGIPDSPFTIYFSEDGEPESFPTLNTATFDSKPTAMYESYSGLVVETELGKWQVTGDNPDFRFDKIINNIGCVGRRAAGETRVEGWAVDRDGMRMYNLNEPHKLSEPIRDKFDDDFDKGNIELMHTFPSKRRNLIGMFVADSDAAYKGNNYIYQYPIDDISKGWWWELVLPTDTNLVHVAEIEDADGVFHLYAAGGSDGMLYKLFDPDTKNWVSAAGAASAITTTATTKWFRPGGIGVETEHATGRVDPRFIELRVSGDTSEWTVTVDTANGPDQTTVTSSSSVTFTFAANQTLLRLPIPNLQGGEFVRITVSNSELGVRSTVIAVRMYFHVRPGQFIVNTGDMDGV